MLRSTVLLEGCAKGPLLLLDDDISFWGGIDPLTGAIIDRRHPQFGESVSGKVLATHRSIGSSSGSSILLELFRQGVAPRAIILAEADFVLTLGAVIAREMDYGEIPVVRIRSSEFPLLTDMLSINLAGEIEACDI